MAPRQRPLTPDDPRHGTYAGYQAEYANGGRAATCERCRAAEVAYQLRLSKDRAYGRPRKVDATGSVRRVRALMAIGYPGTYLARRLNTSRQGLPGPFPTVTVRREAQVKALYAELMVRSGPSSLTRGWARKHGWAAPEQWLGRDIDDPNATPAEEVYADVDEVAVARAAAAAQSGAVAEPLTRAEQVELIRRADRLGISRTTVHKHLKINGTTFMELVREATLTEETA